MKALVCKGIKQPLDYEDIDLPEYDASEFGVVDLQAAALNRRDYWITKGLYPGLRFPTVLGSDGCGIYEGKEVVINPTIRWGQNERYPDDDYIILGLEEYGTFAQQVAVRKSAIHPKPAHLTVEQAAALPLAGVTAYRTLFSRCQVQPGEKVLISGIGGGVALFAFQFALAIGAEVYVTSSSEDKLEKAQEMGATGGVNYTDTDAMKAFSKKVGGFDIVIDSAGGDGFNLLLRMCRKGGRVGVYGGTRGNWEGINVPNVFFKQLSIHGSTMGSDQDFADMLDLVNEHRIVPVVDRVMDLEAGNDALALMKTSPQFGKIVLQIPN
ncbi:zinc-binding dehydrogenase [Flavilitoribacter nigricans]|uniref:Alcohol dehydrogenase n=1 Tax=Flavilitoribacter nigricans (strain ATCC 23147 / DSM 23189 / NBRC 102662 / NCIMB 1420 / SS-2) TaxID=1122177 RepID=A0A2D0MXE8_FLAN2|nr:zinc-binding dehydrogenase [Flavilitoribacter nigricans]PHN00877.1 alcohol dehydrogenase [Flavilitoribacter nigricans DSM 23189 = NBRC 102662]